MIKTVLVSLTGDASDESALETAYLLARPFEAHLDCLHVSPDWSEMASEVAVTDMEGAMAAGDLFGALEDEAAKAAGEARRHFTEFCNRWHLPEAQEPPGPRAVSVAWRPVQGRTAEIPVAQARFRDLAVFGRTPEGRGLDSAILETGRPVVLAPKQAPENLAPTVAIAWKDAPEAARAITAAMPLLMKADKVLVLCADEGLGPQASIESAEGIAVYLRWHGLSAESHYVAPGTRRISEAIMQSAADNRADLLVMGAYGHSRIREIVLGGVTRDVLHDARLPVLFFH